MISGYLQTRKNLLTTFVLIDLRLPPQKNDLDFIENLAEHQMPFALVFTKADKLSPRKMDENFKSYQQFLLEGWEELPLLFVTSSETGLGTDQILAYIEKTNRVFQK